ncbi:MULTISPECIES: RNA-guided endonuclease TnpB family protein [unclassified Streptomyces]|uniref:RNA-guided endonuclease InsQ/TnpB family protein n=1 Tax=unclassified Streptomyces TaxID=2593676 RepID=UPI001164AA1A|nr:MULTISPECIES: RNA-guided endonuclease TnpB family protein [unclassified Streptomyces]NMI55676.1 IS200/IS605 family element transposase accessory protein TnpB [Streptomyces sp. RLA2-12]QDN55169.1 IS200/IS605 family element transposase accessory protein TnpB [Streptomyces sp. S1D4-20]QDN65348.1 IS200/IS605 family element transposase accessory protein TnpB [Streptomyces sp. S1D4-14]QDO47755.1 IS200/IS605 family element transposase accessory protein TnpB [Streptomyces sp. RLB3-5]QDO57994.1 IS20
MTIHVKRAFKYRFCPTDAQAAELSRTFGCVRKVYNMALAARTEAWVTRQERVNYNATSAMLTAWKKTEELAYLNEVSSVPLQQTLRHLQTAFTHFFGKRAKYPRFKSRKKSRGSAEYTTSAFRFRDGALTLAKMTEPLAVVWSRPLPEGAKPSTVTVSQDAAGRWFVSLLCDDPGVKPLPENGNAVGIDVGLEHLLTLSTGEKIANPRHERRDRAALAKAQRCLAKKEKGSANRARVRLKVAKVHARIADRRRDMLHKITTRLVRENQTIVIEDLTVRNMVKNHRLARAISDAAWSEFRSMLEYKAQWYGREVIAVDRWFPSSRLCSACGTLQDRMPLNVRAWTCGCGITHDRDVNAAHNLLAAGLAVTVCGAGVRPQRSTPGGRSATKQKPSRREP